jgi:hypothetical protein
LYEEHYGEDSEESVVEGGEESGGEGEDGALDRMACGLKGAEAMRGWIS